MLIARIFTCTTKPYVFVRLWLTDSTPNDRVAVLAAEIFAALSIFEVSNQLRSGWDAMEIVSWDSNRNIAFKLPPRSSFHDAQAAFGLIANTMAKLGCGSRVDDRILTDAREFDNLWQQFHRRGQST